MKNRLNLTEVILIMTIFVLTACQSTTTPTTSIPTNVNPTESANPSESAYPSPSQTKALNLSAYPGPSQTVGNFVTWSDLESAVMAGKAAQAYVDQVGHVTLVLNDKSVIMALGPAPEAFAQLVTQCGTLCKDLIVTKQ